MTTGKKRFIVGTEGSPDYLVVAETNSHVLGVKPILEPQPNMTVVGVRLRSAYKGVPGDIVEEGAVDTKVTHNDSFNIVWDKVASTHASTSLLIAIERYLWQYDELLAACQSIAIGRKVTRWIINKCLLDIMVISAKEIDTFVMEGISKLIYEFVEDRNILPKSLIDNSEILRQPKELIAKLNKPQTAVTQQAINKGFMILDGGKSDPDNE